MSQHTPTLLARAKRFVRGDLMGRLLPAGWLMSPLYHRWSRDLRFSQSQSADWHEAYQLEHLKKMLAYAERHVPYYRTLFAEHGVRSSDCHDLAYIRKIPLLDKATVRQNVEMLRSECAPKDTRLFTTGGSTGQPLAMYREDSYWDIERAFTTRAWGSIGYRAGDRILQVRGNVIDPARLAGGICWQIDWRDRVMRVSPYDLTPQSLPSLRNAIARFKPRYIHAYPTSALLLANLLHDSGEGLPVALSAVFLGSESVFPHQRRLLAETFGCRVFSHYGQSEAVAVATECRDSEHYHLAPEYALVERLRPDGQPATRQGEEAEIVGTHFHIRAFPLIRYRTNDWVRLETGPSFSKDWPAFPPLGFVIGRGQDVVVRRDGGRVAMTAFSYGRHMNAYRHMEAMQFEQRTPGELIFRVVRGPGFNDDDRRELEEEFARNGRDQIRVEICFVPEIETTRLGKLRHLIQHLPLDGLDLRDVSATEDDAHD